MTQPWPNAAVASGRSDRVEAPITPAQEAEICREQAWGTLGSVLIQIAFAAHWFGRALDWSGGDLVFAIVMAMMCAGFILSFRSWSTLDEGQRYIAQISKNAPMPMRVLFGAVAMALLSFLLLTTLGPNWLPPQFNLSSSQLNFCLSGFFALVSLHGIWQFSALQKLRTQFLA